ncbi:MAG TPA: hypothetical protein VHH14_07695 [Solirubrobacterales bacterium]|jgi:hypothetical protein|nr:hypothetical protein [Solirubrobacterales bacterium]
MSNSDVHHAESDRSADKRLALSYVTEAFAEAELDGLDPDSMVHAALFAAFRELVATYGEEAAAQYAECLPQRVRGGAFTIGPRH